MSPADLRGAPKGAGAASPEAVLAPMFCITVSRRNWDGL